MAEIQTVQTGLKVATTVIGRVYVTTRERTAPKAKDLRRICVLSARDAGALEEHGISQPCSGPECKHGHYTRRQAERLAAAGVLRWVGRSHNVVAWPEDRRWMSRMSAGFSVMQLVDVGEMLGRRPLARILEVVQ